MTIDTRQQLLGTINSQIKLNGTGAITGPILNNVLDTMVNSALFQTGAWSQYTSYAPLDIAEYAGNAYIANVANVNIIPSTDPNTWTPFSSNAAPTAANVSYTAPYTGAVTETVQAKLAQIINVKDFGATGNGSTDDTVAIQAALTAAGANGTINIPAGTYLLSATLNALTNQQIIGAGMNNTIFRRFTDYGNTLNFVNAGAALIQGIWFYHGTMPNTGFTTLTNKATTGAHIRFQDVQSAIIRDCWMWRLPYQIVIEKGSLVNINNCHMQGCWNSFATSAAQEGVASINIGATAYTQLVDITNCYFGGSNSGAQTVSITTSDRGAQSVNFTGTNAGSLYGIYATTCEGLNITGCYMGGNVINNLLFSDITTMSQVKIIGNFFDSAGYNSACIQFTPTADNLYPTSVVIANNCFNNELYGQFAISSVNPYGSNPTLADYSITGNVFANSIGTPIYLRRTQGGNISGNSISAYNARNLTAGGDVNYGAGVYVDTSTSVYVNNNILGGSVNADSPSSYCYLGVVNGGSNTNFVEKGSVWNGVGSAGTSTGRVDKVIVSTTASYTITGYADLVIVNASASGRQIFLPTGIATGYTVTVKDGLGTFATYPVGVIGTIDGATNKTMATNYQSMTFTYNGTQWNVTGN
jgi:hypothetical protein